eukprot:Gregarina_sp_Poly_1__6393@NODE_3408_length_1117_cov_281_382857_g2156_i0_p1_GENE_NODE_3408_length_1117_cov_281_382857_g2156_i0NODE_3408_length_1117_cov_281_382857_g2156_i0_p1_ORF_typecomplete_len170_score9_72Glyco_transf_49/PF13896_6/2e03Glyco_transf_49/PF13896_6/0_17_NODE_3408_length_1117_cov_281_382857_g2156_i0248757
MAYANHDDIDEVTCLKSQDGRKHMFRLETSHILNFTTSLTIHNPASLGYVCDRIQLVTSMHNSDLMLMAVLMPVKDPSLNLRIQLYATRASTCQTAPEASRWLVSPSNGGRHPKCASLAMTNCHVLATTESQDIRSPVFVWSCFIPDFKSRFRYYTNGEGKCYMEVQII